MKLKTTPEAREDARRHITKGGTTLATQWLLNLLADFATLEAELASARKALKEIGAFGNSLAREYLQEHPEEE